MRNLKLAPMLLACSIACSALLSTAMAADDSASDKRGNWDKPTSQQIWFVDTSKSDGDLSVEEEDGAKEYDYKIRLHFENSGTTESKGKAKLGAELPWLEEKEATREHNGKNYVLSGVKATNYISEKASDNVADLYYKLDADEDAIPDSLQKSESKSDFTITSAYAMESSYDGEHTTETTMTVETVVKGNASGRQVMESVDVNRTIGDDGILYRLVRIDVPSLFASSDKSASHAKLYYAPVAEAEDEAPAEPDYKKRDPSEDVCPINGQPAWLCNNTHDHEKMLAAMENGEDPFEEEDTAEFTTTGNEWCDEHGMPAWVCTGRKHGEASKNTD